MTELLLRCFSLGPVSRAARAGNGSPSLNFKQTEGPPTEKARRSWCWIRPREGTETESLSCDTFHANNKPCRRENSRSDSLTQRIFQAIVPATRDIQTTALVEIHSLANSALQTQQKKNKKTGMNKINYP